MIQEIKESNDLYLLYENLSKTKNINILNFIFYHFHKYEHDITKHEIKIKRTEQDIFRDNLISRYKKCIITGNGVDVCQACHIIPFSESKNYDVNNGLLLDNSIHSLFDKYLLTISYKTSQIMIKEKLLFDDNYINFTRYNGMKIENLNQETLKNLKIHNERYLKNN